MCLGGPLNGQEKLKIKITEYCSAFKQKNILHRHILFREVMDTLSTN